MIESLTKEQEAKIPEYVDKWIKIGTCTDRIDHTLAHKIAVYYYEKIVTKKVPPIEVCRSPRECWKKVCELYNEKIPFVWPFLDGHFNAGYFSYYDFLINEVGVKIENEHWEWCMSTVNVGPVFTLDDYCYISDRPSKVKLVNGRLHCEDGPAIFYEDGFQIYSLNGVMVSEELVMTPWKELDCTKLLKEQNAEVRREFVRKAGMEKVIKDLGAELMDKQGDYELLSLNLGDGSKRPYLKMTNPSVGCYHVEGISPECKTVEDALRFRNGTTEKPVVLT